MSKKVSIPVLLVIAILVADLVINNLAVLQYAPIITTFLNHTNL